MNIVPMNIDAHCHVLGSTPRPRLRWPTLTKGLANCEQALPVGNVTTLSTGGLAFVPHGANHALSE
jgi:hypothetical protein